jgi:hypothetical protein
MPEINKDNINNKDSRFSVIEKNYKGHSIIFDKHYSRYCWGVLTEKKLDDLKIKIRDRPDKKNKEEYKKKYAEKFKSE